VIQAASIYVDVNRRTLERAWDMTLGPDLVISMLGSGAPFDGFHVGDRLTVIDGEGVSTLLDYRAALNRHRAGTTAHIVVIRGDGTRELSAMVGREPISAQFLLRHAAAVILIALGTVVAYFRFEDKAARLFFLSAVTLGVYFATLYKSMVGLVYLQILALTLAPGLILHLFFTFPKERWLVASRWWFVLYLPGLVLMGLTMRAFSESVAAGTGIWYSPSYAAMSNIGFAFLASTGVTGLILTGLTYAGTPQSLEKRQLQWVMWGLACAVAAAAVDILLTLSERHTQASDLSILGVIALAVAFALAILRHRLLDIEFVINHSAVYAVLTAVLVALYFLLVGLLSNALGVAVGTGGYTAVMFVSALVIGLLFNPVRDRIQTTIDKAFFPQKVDFQVALSQWSEELSTSIRFSELTQLLAKDVPQQLQIDCAALLVLDESERHLEALPGEDGEPTAVGGLGNPRSEKCDSQSLEISARDPFVVSLFLPGKVILIGEAQREDELQGQQDDRPPLGQDAPLSWIEAGVQVVLPLMSGRQLVGVYLLGRKLSGDIYQRGELDLLRTLANQAGVAIANARLYEQVSAISQEMEAKVQEQMKELREFVSVVYHELRTPMTSIRGYSELLLEGKAGLLEPKQKRYLGRIHSNVRRLANLVADLSDLSQIADGLLAVHPEPVDLREAAEETVGLFSGTIEEKGLQVEIDLSPGAEYVLGDAQRVVQILTNLVGNACRYTPAGGQIRIASYPADGLVEMTVQDTGIGIRQEDLDRIFDRFFRSDDPLVQEQPGMGLGLAIARSLVELHGSELWVKSQVGSGSTFGFHLPGVEADYGQR
jgi:signal transduction histidine kinase